MPKKRPDSPASHPPSPLAGEGARRADEGAPPGEIPATKSRSRRVSPTPKDTAIRHFAKAMRGEPTLAEAKLWRILRGRRFSGYKFRRQVPIGSYIVDFVCYETKMIVEADGSHHSDSATDPKRDAWLAAQGFRMRRFWNADIMLRPWEVTDTIWADLAGET